MTAQDPQTIKLWTTHDERQYRDQIDAVADEIKRNWLKWQELTDDNCEFAARAVALRNKFKDSAEFAIEFDSLVTEYAERCAEWVIDGDQWHGIYGDLKNAAGLFQLSTLRKAA